MALNSEVTAVDVRAIRVRDLDQSEERKQLAGAKKTVVGIKSSVTAKAGTSFTLTAAELLNGFINGTPTGAGTYTFPTAALMVAAIPGAAVGDTFVTFLQNTAGAANTITLAAGGATLVGGTAVAQNKSAIIAFTLTNVTLTTEAYTAFAVVGA